MALDVATQLGRARERLLDMTLRNRLLNFRPTRRTTIHVVDERPEQIWRLLVCENRVLEFLAREEFEGGSPLLAEAESASETQQGTEPVGNDESAAFAIPSLAENGQDASATPARYKDRFLQTALAGEELQTNLLRIYGSATSALDERGVNVLFIAVGFLAWRQADDVDTVLKAPVFLIPVSLERTSAKRRFHLGAMDDEPVLNPCLMKKLQDLRIAIPPLPDAWEDLDMVAWLGKLEAAVATQGRWQVLPELYLGLFSFTKYLMYVDLDPDRWPDHKPLLGNPLLQAMCGDASMLPDRAESLPDPKQLDEQLDPEEMFHVVDADSSQQVAILAARNGANLVIEGPPGTGKSQTITNIIAECLAQQKTVLFVSQKMAALEVVKRRLEKVGLGDFCLELHSTKANRRSLLKELERVLERAGETASLSAMALTSSVSFAASSTSTSVRCTSPCNLLASIPIGPWGASCCWARPRMSYAPCPAAIRGIRPGSTSTRTWSINSPGICRS